MQPCSSRGASWLLRSYHGARAKTSLWDALTDQISIWNKLSKAKLSFLVVSTAATGYVVASPASVNYTKLAWTSLGTFLTSACANCLNQIYEVRNDKLMARTKNRPLPSGRISMAYAALFALTTGTSGAWILSTKVGCLPRGRRGSCFTMRHVTSTIVYFCAFFSL